MRINLKFVGFLPFFPPETLPFYKILEDNLELCISENPDYLIDRGLSFDHLKYDCIKILFLGENYVPDFNMFDYAVGFDDLSFGDRYIRHPLFARYSSYPLLAERKKEPDASLLSRKFCSFVVSNSEFADPMREKFLKRLSQYKKVDSGGRFLNNIGGPVKDKLAFLREYKFNIAFENSVSPGYTTEKIMEAYVAQSIPIYYGNPTVETDFRLNSMVRIKDESDIDRAIEEIIRLDNDDDAYMEMVTARCLTEDDPGIYDKRLLAFLTHIFEQPLELARRRNRYGYQAMMAHHMKMLLSADQKIRDSFLWKWALLLRAFMMKVCGK
jgi:hypothetical protein